MAVDIKLARLVVPIVSDAADFVKGLGSAESAAAKFGKNVQRVGGVALKAAGAAAVATTGAVVGLGAGLIKLASEAAPLEQIEGAFNGIAQAAGTTGDAMLTALKQGTSEMVPARDLMMSFNKAAQLVGQDFAVQLPDAMQYLGKVAGATGQDVGFLLDSLVTGVGRLSPMILDNLGIQVSLSEATEEASKMFGVEASELTKAQQQAGMMNVVLAKLAKNTAAMPDIAGSAAANQAAFAATLQDTKDAIGKAVIPAFNNLMMAVRPIIDRLLPVLVDLFENSIAPALELVTGFISAFIAQLGQTDDPLEALSMALESVGLDDLQERFVAVRAAIEEFISRVQEVFDAVMPYVEAVWEWIQQNIELQDVLIALGVIIASVVVPAVLSLVASAAPLLLAIGAILAIVVLLRKAWEENFLGIQEIVASVVAWFQTNVPPAFERIKEAAAVVFDWLRENIPPIFETIKQIVATALAFVKDLWDRHGEAIMAVVSSLWNLLKAIFERGVAIVKGIIDFFKSDSESSWSEWSEVLQTIVGVLWDVLNVLFDLGLKNLKTLFDIFAAVFRGDWDAVWEGIKQIFENIWEAIKTIAERVWSEISGAFDSFKSTLQPVADAIKGFFKGISNAIDTISSAISAVINWFSDLIAKIQELAAQVLPPWLKLLSPPELAQSLAYIASAARVAGEALNLSFRAELERLQGLSLAPVLEPTVRTPQSPAIQRITEQNKTVSLTYNNADISKRDAQRDYFIIQALA